MGAYYSFSDAELTDLIKAGDQNAFTEIYNRFQGVLYLYACKITRDDDIAEDLVQELFINLWDKRQSLNFTSSVSSYFYAAVRYKFFDLVDKQKVRTDYLQNMQFLLDQGSCDTDNYMDEKELSATIENAVSELPGKMRAVFLLSRKNNLSNKEISEQLGIAEKTVKNQLSMALKALKVKLGLHAFLFLLMYY